MIDFFEIDNLTSVKKSMRKKNQRCHSFFCQTDLDPHPLTKIPGSAHVWQQRPTSTRTKFPTKVIIGITHVFHALTFAGSRGSCLNTRPSGQTFKHRPRDPASVNAMKQTCVIVILAYLT